MATSLALLGGAAEARDVLDPHRIVLQALRERAEVLLGQDRRGHQHHHLLVVLDRFERRTQRHLGLAVADIAADQPVHRAGRLHVGLDELDRIALIRSLGVREGVLEFALPIGIRRERDPHAVFALGVQVEQLPGQLLGGPARPRLDLIPAIAAELGQRRMLAARADVAADLGQLVDRHEHAVGARIFEGQIVPRDAGHRLCVKPGEPRDPVVLVDDDVAGAQLGEAAQHASSPRLRWPLHPPAAPEQPVLGDHRQVELRRDEPLPQARLGEDQTRRAVLRRCWTCGSSSGGRAVGAVQPRHLQPPQVVGGPLALAPGREGDHRLVARAGELLQLGLGLLDPPGGDLGRLGPEAERLVLVYRRQADPGTLVKCGGDVVRLDVQVVGLGVVEGRAHVLPMV